jgi:integrase
MKPLQEKAENMFKSHWRDQLHSFLLLKRSIGCKYQSEERLLVLLDRFLLTQTATRAPGFNREMATEFVARKGNESDANRSNRLGVLRQFCRFLAIEEPTVFIPPIRFLKINHSNFTPRILTRAERGSFVKSCQIFPPAHCSPVRGIVLGTAILLLFLSGMRVGEVIRLKVHDVDFDSGVLHIRNTKFGKSRFVPIAPDLMTRLRLCQDAITARLGQPLPAQPFFCHSSHKSYSKSALHEAFHQILTMSGIVWKGEGKRLRLHDLRHNAAVLRMLLWYEEGAKMEAKLPILATYLGHYSLEGTQHYLHLTRELLMTANSSYQRCFGDIISDEVVL